MNVPIPSIWTTGSTEAVKTGTWRAALPRYISAPSPCHVACPVSGDIAMWIGRAREGDYRSAWEILTRNNPFPAVAGRVCHHPCEAACNRAGFDEPLAICRLERHIGDLAIEQGWAFAAPAVARSERMAIVGAGPAGLSAAYHLRRRGYAVTLYESRAQLGGLMRYGIPPYRLARSVLDAEIARIVALGVDVRCGEPLAAPEQLERLRSDFDAVFVAIGAQRQKRLPLGVIIEGMPRKAGKFLLVLPKRRNPVGIAAIDLPRQRQKLVLLPLRLDWNYGDIGHQLSRQDAKVN